MITAVTSFCCLLYSVLSMEVASEFIYEHLAEVRKIERAVCEAQVGKARSSKATALEVDIVEHGPAQVGVAEAAGIVMKY